MATAHMDFELISPCNVSASKIATKATNHITAPPICRMVFWCFKTSLSRTMREIPIHPRRTARLTRSAGVTRFLKWSSRFSSSSCMCWSTSSKNFRSWLCSTSPWSTSSWRSKSNCLLGCETCEQKTNFYQR